MATCLACSAELSTEHHFCPTCGAPAPAAADEPTRRRAVPLIKTMAPPSPPVTPPVTPPVMAPPSPVRAPFDAGMLLRGNWFGALVVGCLALLVTLVLSVVDMLALTARTGLGASDRAHVVATLLGRTYGAGLHFDTGGGGGGVDRNVSLFVALLATVLAAVCFSRVVGAAPGPLPAALDAVRAALVFAVLMTAVGAFAGGEDGVGGSAPGESVSVPPLEIFASSFGVLLVVLLLVVAARRTWPAGAAAPWCWPAARAALWCAATVPVAGVLALIIEARGGDPSVGGSGQPWYYTVVDRVLRLNSDAVSVVGSGSGSKVGLFRSGDESSATARISDLAQRDSLWWVAIPLVVVIVLGAVAWLVQGLTRVPLPQRLLAAGVWFVVLVAGTPVFLWFLAERQSSDIGGDDMGGYYGADIGLTTLILAGAFAVGALVAVGIGSALARPAPATPTFQPQPVG